MELVSVRLASNNCSLSDHVGFILPMLSDVKFSNKIVNFSCISLTCSQQAARSRHFELRPTPTLRRQWGESSLSLLWRDGKKTWPWQRGRFCLQLSTSLSLELLGTRLALCLLRLDRGHPRFLARLPFRLARLVAITHQTITWLPVL